MSDSQNTETTDLLDHLPGEQAPEEGKAEGIDSPTQDAEAPAAPAEQGDAAEPLPGTDVLTQDKPSEDIVEPAPESQDAETPAAPESGDDAAPGTSPEPATIPEGPSEGQDGTTGADITPPAADLSTEPPAPEAPTAPEAPAPQAPEAPAAANSDTPATAEDSATSASQAEDGPSGSDDGAEGSTPPSAPVDAGSNAAATPPAETEGGDEPEEVSPLVVVGGISEIPSVKVGDKHVAQNVDQQTIGAALASAAANHQTLDDYLAEQGVGAAYAPQLTRYAAKKHGRGIRKSRREWSVVIREYYCEDDAERAPSE